MMQCPYGQEPADGKLLLLRLLGKWKTVLLAALLGALIPGGIYYLINVPLGPAPEYEAVTDFYLDYALQENGEEYTYFNQVTWDQLIKEDLFTETISAAVNVPKEYAESAVSATLLSDTRIVTTTVTTTDPNLTLEINKALIGAMFTFCDNQKEIANVKLYKAPDRASLVKQDVRTFRAAVTGMVCTLFVTLLVLCLYILWDDSLWIPESLEKRYGIPSLGTKDSPEYAPLCKKYYGEENFEMLYLTTPEPADLTDTLLQGTAPILLAVPAGAHNGKAAERVLSLCKKCNREVRAAVLTDPDEKLLSAYRRWEHPLKALKKNGQV